MATTTPASTDAAPADLAPTRSTRGLALAAFGALLLRDLTVLRKDVRLFVIRTIMQPLGLLFVFTYVFPKIGQGVGGSAGAAQFTTLLTAGVMGSSMIFGGIQAVALPLVQDFGFTREIEDRVLAPLPIWAVAFEKVVQGSVQALLAALIVLPLALVVPATDVHLQVRPLPLALLLVLASLLSGSLGLAVGTRVQPRQVALIFSLLVIPLTFLSCVYYPWQSLAPIRWLQVAVLANPLVYVNEGLRACLAGDTPHMDLLVVYVVIVGFTAVLLALGIDGFRRRVLS
jgi:ABC-2 type transport system permease protein